MIDIAPLDLAAYVASAAPALGLRLTAERQAAVAEAFALVLHVASPALAFDLPRDTEPAPVFTP